MNQGGRRGGKTRNMKIKDPGDKKKGRNYSNSEIAIGNTQSRKTTTSMKSTAPPGFDCNTSSSSSQMQSTTSLSDETSRILRERLIFAVQSLVGCKVDIQVTNGTVYTGNLYTVRTQIDGNPDFLVVLKKAQLKKGEKEEGFLAGGMLMVEGKDLAQLKAPSVILADRGTGDVDGILIDTEISGGSKTELYGRELESAHMWLASDGAIEGDLEEDLAAPRNRSKSNGGEWNQFEANEKLFGVKSSYDENLYTTKLDKRKITSEQSREAAKIAKEIENQTTSNFHLAEERGQVSEETTSNLDEESRYSSVIRTTTKPITTTTNATTTTTTATATATNTNTNTNTTTGSRSPYIPPALRGRSGHGKEVSSDPTKEVVENDTLNPVPRINSSVEAEDLAPAKSPESTNTLKNPSKFLATSSNEKVDVSTTAASGAGYTSISPSTSTSLSPSLSPSLSASTSTSSSKVQVGSETAKSDVIERDSETVSGSNEKSKTSSKSTLNAKAKEFKLSATAKAFTPKFITHTPKPYTPMNAMHPRGGHSMNIPMNMNMMPMQGGLPPQYAMNMYRPSDEWQQYDPMLMDDGTLGMSGYGSQYMQGQIPPSFVGGMQGGRHVGYHPMMPQMMNVGMNGQMHMMPSQTQPGPQQNMQQSYAYGHQSLNSGYPSGSSPSSNSHKHISRNASGANESNHGSPKYRASQKVLSPQSHQAPRSPLSTGQPPLPSNGPAQPVCHPSHGSAASPKVSSSGSATNRS